MRIDREKYYIAINPSGITELYLKNDTVIELEDSLDMEKELNNCRPKTGHLLLIVSEPGVTVTKESRDYSKNNPLDAKAMAVVTNSLPQRLIMNVIRITYKKLLPDYPVRLFAKTDKAKEWLLTH